MKEEKLIRKRKNPKGSVLFTVVAVMMVMIVFVMATLTIAGAANKRAYASYSKNQATYTSRSAIDATVAALKNDGDFSRTVNNNLRNPGDKIEIAVSMPDGSMGSTTVIAEYVDTDNFAEQDPNDATKLVYNPKDIIKLSATTSFGDIDSSTVSLTYVKDYIPPSSSGGGGGGNALTTMGNNNLNVGLNVIGGISSGINSSRWFNDDRNTKQYKQPTSGESGHFGTINGNFTVNGTFRITAQGTINFNGKGEGLKIFGDYNPVNPIGFTSNVDTKNNSMNYNDIPYIYVERALKPDKNTTQQFGSKDNPVIIYCGGYAKLGQVKMYSDLYVYNHDFSLEDTYTLDNGTNNGFVSTNTFKYDMVVDKVEHTESWGTWYEYTIKEGYVDSNTNNFINSVQYVNGDKPVTELFCNNSPSELLSWTSNLVTKADGSEVVSGSFYTEGSAILGNNNSGGTIDGNCYVANDLYIGSYNNWSNKFEGGNGTTTIKGSLTVKDNLIINRDNIRVGYLDCDPAKLYIVSNNCKINNVEYNTYKNNSSYADDTARNTAFINEVNSKASTIGGLDIDNGSVSIPADKTVDNILGLNGPSAQIVEVASDTASDYKDGSGNFDKTRYKDEIPATFKTYTDTINYTSFNGMSFIESSDTNNKLGENAWYITNSCSIGTYGSATWLNGNNGANVGGTYRQSKKIYIDPGAGELWIEIRGTVNFDALDIIVNDTQGGKVNFFLSDGASINTDNGGDTGKFLTLTYKNAMDSHNQLELHTYQKVQDEANGTTYTPNLYFYAVHNPTSTPKIYLGNGGIITGYILAPYVDVHMENNVSGFHLKDFVEEDSTGTEINRHHIQPGDSVAVIGSAVVNNFKGTNGCYFIYVSDEKPSASTPPTTPGPSTGAIEIYELGYNNG